MIKKYALLILLVWLCWMLLYGCKKEEPLPDNPYDSIERPDTTTNPIDFGRNSIADIHKRILLPRCALPGCHVGNFEPDFRTAQSSYATMVYHPIIKNNAANTFKYRVIPYDTARSLLYERITNCCFVNVNDRMPQDNIGQPLPAQDIADIADWIMKGARDIFGNPPQFPNTRPKVINYLAFKSDFSVVYSIDTAYREQGLIYMPFRMPNNTDVTIAFQVTDDSTAVSALQLNQLKLSLSPDDFSNPVAVKNCFYFAAPQGEFWLARFNTATLPNNQTLYMRYYVRDNHPQNITEFPHNDLPMYYKTYASFKIMP
jgi:hypothetical protein